MVKCLIEMASARDCPGGPKRPELVVSGRPEAAGGKKAGLQRSTETRVGCILQPVGSGRPRGWWLTGPESNGCPEFLQDWINHASQKLRWLCTNPNPV